MNRKFSLPLSLFCLSIFGLLLPAEIFAAATATFLTISPNDTVVVGTVVTLKAAVSSGSTPVSPGLVYFCNSDAAYCEDLNILGQAQLMPGGSASISLRLPIGVHKIQAVFRGTNSSAGSTSQIETITVTGKYTTGTTISEVESFGKYALTGTVTSYGAPTLTGTVGFRDSTNHNLLLASTPLGPSSLVFPTVSSSGSNTLSLGTTGDFNHDGKFDQAVINGSGVTILFGKGDGTFSLGPTTALGFSPAFLITGDFNGDDVLDLAVADSVNNAVSILLGSGDGSFSVASPFSTTQRPLALAVGDFNNDGKEDLVVGLNLNGLAIYLGDGAGNFALKSSLAVGYFDSFIIVSDFNGDGKADLVFTEGNPVAHIALGNGDGTFSESTNTPVPCTIGGCGSVVTADFNGDGRPDLAVADFGQPEQENGRIEILLNNGDGTFTTGNSIEGGFPYFLSLGDFNGDGIPDLVTGNNTYPSMYLYLGEGGITFDNGRYVSNTSSSFVLGDFNGDSRSDLAISNPLTISLAGWQSAGTANNISLEGRLGLHQVFAKYPGDGDHYGSSSGTIPIQGPQAATTTTLSAAPLPILPGQTVQLTATISPSHIGQDHPSGTVTLSNGPTVLGTAVVSNGQAIFSTKTLPTGSNLSLTAFYSGDTQFARSVSAPVHLTTTGAPRSPSSTTLKMMPSSAVPAGTVVTLTATVFDNGTPVTPGLVLFYSSSERHHWETLLGQAQLTSNGTATFRLRLGNGEHGIRAVFQGTNTVASSTSKAKCLFVTGKLSTNAEIYAGPPASSASATNDSASSLEGELPPTDAINNNPIPAKASLHRTATKLTYTLAPSPDLGTAQAAVATGDFNGDGILDLATLTESNTLIILRGQADGSFIQSSTINLVGYAASIAVADFNSDGKLDLAIPQSGSQGTSVAVLLGNGNGTFTTNMTPPLSAGHLSIVAGDFNGDGIPDLVTTNYDGSTTTLLGVGNGTFVIGASTGLGGAPPTGPAVITDFNKDGILDVATLSDNFGAVILLGNGDGTFATKSIPNLVTCLPTTLASADFNRDGFPDLISGNCGGYPLQSLLGNGDGTFTRTPLPFSYDYLVSALADDFNDDGIPDLMAVDSLTARMDILIGQGDGSLVAGPSISLGSGNGPQGAAVGDFNGDGTPDIVIANGFVNTMSVLLAAITNTAATTTRLITPVAAPIEDFVGAVDATYHVRRPEVQMTTISGH